MIVFHHPTFSRLPPCSSLLPLVIFFPQILEETKEKLEHMTALANQRDTEIGPLTPLDSSLCIYPTLSIYQMTLSSLD